MACIGTSGEWFMDTHDYLLIRFATFTAMLVLWIAGAALAAHFGRRRSTSTKTPGDPASVARFVAQ
jgi:hypothetical protein